MFVYGDVVILKIGLGGIDPEKHSIEPPSYASTAYIIVCLLFRKNLGNLRVFFGQMVYRPPPPWQKIARAPMPRGRLVASLGNGRVSPRLSPLPCWSRLLLTDSKRELLQKHNADSCVPRVSKYVSNHCCSIDPTAVLINRRHFINRNPG